MSAEFRATRRPLHRLFLTGVRVDCRDEPADCRVGTRDWLSDLSRVKAGRFKTPRSFYLFIYLFFNMSQDRFCEPCGRHPISPGDRASPATGELTARVLVSRLVTLYVLQTYM